MKEYVCICGAGYYVKEPRFIATHNGIFSYSEDDIYPVLIRLWNGSFCSRCANLAIQFMIYKGMRISEVYFYAFFRGGYVCNRKEICRLNPDDVAEFWLTSRVKHDDGVFYIGGKKIITTKSLCSFCDVVSDGVDEEIPYIVRNIDTYPYSAVNNAQTIIDAERIAKEVGLKRAVWMREFEGYVINTEKNTTRGGVL